MNNFFEKREIKKLRNVAGGETYTIVYLKLMLLSLGEQGNIFFEETESDVFEQIAIEINERYEDVKMTLLFLEKNNLCKINDTQDISLQEVPTLIGSETQSTIRSRKSRALQSNTTATQLQHTSNVEIDIEKDIEKELKLDTKKEKEIKRFSKPSIKDIQAYCDERGNGIDSEAFWNHYESKGWVIGKSPMKSWQSAIITWEKKKKEDSKNKYKTNGYSKKINQDQRDELLTMMNDKTQKMFGNKGD